MAKDYIKGISIALGGDSTGLQKAINQVNASSGALRRELSQVERALKFDPTNTTLVAQKQEILAQQVKVTSEKLQQLKSVQESVNEEYKKGNITGEAYREYQRELIKTENQLQSLEAEQRKGNNTAEKAADTTEKLSNEEKTLAETTDKAKDSSSGFSKTLEGLKSAADVAVSAVGTVAGAVGDVMTATVNAAIDAGKAAAGVGMGFESSVSQLAATMGTTKENITALSDTAKELGATTQFSASQAAEGLNILAMSGLTAEEQTAAVGDVLNLAAAGSLSLSQAASYTTGAIKGFGDSMDNASYYTDMIAKGATLANTDVNGLGMALSTAAATANSYGQQADGVTLALLRLAEQNVTGSEAATMMNRAMADLYTPSDTAKAALDKLGISAYDSSGKARDFNEVVDELNKSISGMSEEEANAAKNAIFTTNGLNAFNKMTASSVEKVNSLRDGLADASGSAQAQAETMIDNLQGDITIMQSAAEGLGITFYEVFDDDLRSYVQLATEGLGDITKAFQEDGISGAAESAGKFVTKALSRITETLPDVISSFSIFFNSVGRELTRYAPTFARTVGEIVQTIAKSFATNTRSILTSVTVAAHNIIGELPSIIYGLIGSGSDFVQAIIWFFNGSIAEAAKALPGILSAVSEGLLEELPIITATLFDLITSTVQAVMELLPEIIPTVLELVSGLITAFAPQIITAVITLANGIVDSLPVIINTLVIALPTLINSVVTALLAELPSLINGVITLVGSLTASFPTIISTIVAVVPQIISSVVTAALALLPSIVKAGLELFSALVKALPEIINAITLRIPDIIDAIVEATLGALPQIIDCGIDLFLALIDELPTVIHEIQMAIPRIIAGIVTAIERLYNKLVKAGTDALLELIADLPFVIDEIKKKMPDIIYGIIGALEDNYYRMVDIGSNLLLGMWEGIQNTKDWLKDRISEWCESVTDSIKDFFGIHSPSSLFRDEIGENLALGVGEGFESTMRDVSRDMRDMIPTKFDVAPIVDISDVAPNMRIAWSGGYSMPNVNTSIGSGISFTLQIENFNNSYGTAVEDLSERAAETFFSYVQRKKLA